MNDKIKHLLATADKTDSIAKNKWRIENREQLREQRKRKLEELMEKDNEMSNNKQSSIEWYSVKRDVLEIEVRLGKLSANEYAEELAKAEQQAKAMQKQQHGKTWDDAMENMKARGGNDMRAYTDFDDYYAETYGGNNE
jgi:uncharacterized protein YPO0396